MPHLHKALSLAANLDDHKMRQFLLTLFTIIIFSSCDCNQVVSGKIIDDKSGKPLSNVTIYNKNKTWSKTKTDTAGHFQLSNISVGYGCPPMTVIVEENNYKKIEIFIDADGQKEIRLQKIIQLQTDTLDQIKAIKILRDIFQEYNHNEEGIDSEDNKNAVTKSIKSLNGLTNPSDLELLINIWQYYDPTDYSCRQLILNFLLQNKTKSIAAVKDRMKNKKSWETGETEFRYLLKELEAE